jgi:rhodanese-related sulfurtransferase
MTDPVTGAALLAQIDAGTAPAIVDVRSGREFRRGHVPGARHIPFWLMPVRISQVPGSRTSPLVVYCGHGPRAYLAGAVLRWAGFQQVRYLDGHMRQWRSARLREDRPGPGPGPESEARSPEPGPNR